MGMAKRGIEKCTRGYGERHRKVGEMYNAACVFKNSNRSLKSSLTLTLIVVFDIICLLHVQGVS